MHIASEEEKPHFTMFAVLRKSRKNCLENSVSAKHWGSLIYYSF
jgi:hypothetical protein